MKKLTSYFVIILLFTSAIKAQSLEETLSQLSRTAGKAYIAPVVTAFGSNLNSGWVSLLPKPTKVGFHFDVKVMAMGSIFSKENNTFTTSGDFYFSAAQVDQILNNSGVYTGNPKYSAIKNELLTNPFTVNFSGPTVVGKKIDFLRIVFPGRQVQGVSLASNTFNVTAVKGYLDELPALPTIAPQITVGTLMGTNVSVRYLPDVDVQDMGKFTFFGVGAIHNPAVWFPNPLPVDLGIGYFTQKMKVGTIFESTATQYGVFVSKTFGVVISITPYAGYVTEEFKTSISYDYQSNETINGVLVPKTKIKFDIDGENKNGFIVGFSLNLAAVRLNADYKMSKINTASAGISFGM